MPDCGTEQPVRSSDFRASGERMMVSFVLYFSMTQPLRSLNHWMSLDVTPVVGL